MPTNLFGHVAEAPIGTTYPDRAALREAGIHRQNQAGITGLEAEGAESIVLNEGYEDDIDRGDEIIYTGEGGRDRQCSKRARTCLAETAAAGAPSRNARRRPRGAGGGRDERQVARVYAGCSPSRSCPGGHMRSECTIGHRPTHRQAFQGRLSRSRAATGAIGFRGTATTEKSPLAE